MDVIVTYASLTALGAVEEFTIINLSSADGDDISYCSPPWTILSTCVTAPAETLILSIHPIPLVFLVATS